MYARWLLGLWALTWQLAVQAQPVDGQPPLTLEAALAAADADNPVIAAGAANVALATSDRQAAEGLTDPTLKLRGELRYVEPPSGLGDQSNNDSMARLVARQRLYDFGYTAAREQAAELGVEGADWALLDTRQQHRLAVMRAFFDVLLADMRFARDNEAMSVVYVALDRARDRHQLGQVSDVRLAELNADYQQVRQGWARSRTLQRLTRTRLAQLLNRPDDPPAELQMPDPVDATRKLPEDGELVTQALAANPQLKALRAGLESAEQQVTAARKTYGPVISAEAEAGAYARRLGSRNDWEAGLVFEMPLYAGRSKDAAVAHARAQRDALRAKLQAAELAVRQQVLENRLALDDLKIKLEQVAALGDYRELYLDRSRALYEMEVKTDLGDAMVQISAVRLARAEAEFDWRMARARLAALTGQLIDPTPQEDNTP